MLRYLGSILLVTAFTAFGEFSLGVDLSCSVNNSTSKNPNATIDEQSTGKNTYNIVPFVGIHPNNLIEISPSFGWYVTSTSSKITYKTNTPDQKSSSTQQSIEPGCGVFFHILKGKVFDVSLGPKLGYRVYFEPKYKNNGNTVPSAYSSYYNGSTSVGCQFNIDLLFSKKFASRLSTNLFRFNYDSYSFDYKTGTTSEGHSSIIDIKSIFQPMFGFLFTF